MYRQESSETESIFAPVQQQLTTLRAIEESQYS